MDRATTHERFWPPRESSDGGRTWSEKDEIVLNAEGGFNIMSVSLLRLKTGDLALFYLRKNSLEDCRPVMRVSKDEARSWSAPIGCIRDEVGYYVLNNSRVIQLASGRLVMPTALHRFEAGRIEPGKVVVYVSDDAARSGGAAQPFSRRTRMPRESISWNLVSLRFRPIGS